MAMPPEQTEAHPRSGTGALYPVEVKVRMTAAMFARLERQAAQRELGISATVRVGLNNWLAAAEKRAA